MKSRRNNPCQNKVVQNAIMRARTSNKLISRADYGSGGVIEQFKNNEKPPNNLHKDKKCKGIHRHWIFLTSASLAGQEHWISLVPLPGLICRSCSHEDLNLTAQYLFSAVPDLLF